MLKREYYINTGVRKRIYREEDGKLHGLEEKFSTSGSLISTCEYSYGDRHGLEIFYEDDPDKVWLTVKELKRKVGKVIKSRTWENGTLQGAVIDYYNGEVRAIYALKDQKLHGPFKKYSLDGKLVLDIFFKDGVQTQLKEDLNFKNLEKLIDFYEELDPKKFDISFQFSSGCGTRIGPAGWFPEIFPGEVISHGFSVDLKGMRLDKSKFAASYMLNLSLDIADCLFSPGRPSNKMVLECSYDTKPKEFAERLQKFKKLVLESK